MYGRNIYKICLPKAKSSHYLILPIYMIYNINLILPIYIYIYMYMYTLKNKVCIFNTPSVAKFTHLKGQWHRKFLLAISILLDDLTMKILSFRSQTF